MPQLILAFLGLILLVWVVAMIVWVIQWIVATVVWVFQALLLPVLIFLIPAILLAAILSGLFWGNWVAAKNYLHSVRKNINPEGSLKLIVRNGVVMSQALALTVLCGASAVAAGITIYFWSLEGVSYVQSYYAAIEFPAFKIVFPFWN